jgi:hypothetical protein
VDFQREKVTELEKEIKMVGTGTEWLKLSSAVICLSLQVDNAKDCVLPVFEITTLPTARDA